MAEAESSAISFKPEARTISFKPVEGNIPALVDENGDALSDEAAGKAIAQNSKAPINWKGVGVLALGCAAGIGFLGKNEYGKRTPLSVIKSAVIGTGLTALLYKNHPVFVKKAPELADDIKAGWKYAEEQKKLGNSGVDKFTSILTNIRYDGQSCSASDYDPDP